ncbi:splicing factor U2af large subunit B-like isoform X1 [Cynara cardunculus var. scolymus]|uniref:splicing factor U2af large subunit B-like isoform X1 n=2 Tax=Cynara cardunculus var. scolymus TaxID=59895 RepID=UPI000D622F4D|nr:splicing factor U2af large subunit B-like isoform X1 [Cynara cardunculus var. scolymus]
MSSRHDSRHTDGSGGSLPYDEFEDRDFHLKHNSRGDNERLRTTDPDRGKDRDRRHRDYSERSGRDERGRGRNDDNGRGNRDYSRRHDYDRDRERHHRHRSRSASPDRSRDTSRSRSKSKRTSGFDMAPPTAATLPGAAGQFSDVPQSMPGMLQNMFPFGTTQLGALPLMPAQAMTQQATRHARRVYVGGLPPLANEQTIAAFFSHIMTAIGGNSAGPAGDAVVNVYINHEKKFAFVEMRTVEEASNAMALDGIIFEGVSVRVRRPTDYNPSLAAVLGPSQPNPNLNLAAAGLAPGGIGGAEGPDRVFVGGLPYYFTEVQIRELLESFGPLRGFDLVKDRDTGNSKGYGFCVYEDQAVTDVACAALNGLKMGDKTLTVRRATISSGQMKSEQDTILAQAQQHIAMQKMALQIGGFNLPGAGPHEVPTKILCLTEVITANDLMDDGEYEEILEDMREEGRKFGNLTNVVIPRPNPSGDQVQGLGKVFLEYADTNGCAKAKDSLGGRKFGGNVVTAVYYPEDKYLEHDYGA